jgi:diguanylate cyclase (GGDEF)-like protein
MADETLEERIKRRAAAGAASSDSLEARIRARATAKPVAPASPASTSTPGRGGGILDAAKAALSGAAQGSTLGFADEALGGIDAVNALLPKALGGEDVALKDFGARYRQGRDKVRQVDAQLDEEHGFAHGAGELAGGVASAIAGGGAAKGLGLVVPKSAPVLARALGVLGEGAAYGGAMGAGNADGETESTASRAEKGAIGGMLGAAVLAGGSKVVGKIGTTVLDKVPAVRNNPLANLVGVNTTRQRAEQVLARAVGRGAEGQAGASAARGGILERAGDVLNRRGAEERRLLQRQVETDALTGVGNRRALDKALPAAEKDPHTSVVFFDANNFGKVNKLVSDEAGDQHLKNIAQALTQAADEHGATGRVFRKGGDEFVILAPADKASAIRDRAEELFGEHPIGSGDNAVTVSLTGTHGSTLAEADAQLQAAKQARKAGVAPAEATSTDVPPIESARPAVPAMPRKPLTVADLNENTRQLARSVYDTPSAGKDQLHDVLSTRHEGQIERRGQDLETLLGAKRENVFQSEHDLLAQQEAAASPLYEHAKSFGAVDDPELQQLLASSPGLQRGWKHVEELNKETGKKLPQILRTRQVDEPIVFDGVALTNPDGTPRTMAKHVTETHELPTIDALHELKLAVDREISDLSGSIYAKDRAKARALMDTQAKLVEIMDRHTTDPATGESAYRTARETFAGHAKGLDAFSLGRDKFLRMDPREIAQLLGGMSSSEQQLFRRGAHDAYATAQEALGPRGEASLSKMTLSTSPERKRLEALFPTPDHGAALADATKAEAAMARTHTKVLGGSQTSTNTIGQEQHGLEEAALHAGSQLLTANPGSAIRTLWQAAMKRTNRLSPAIADELAPMLLAGSPPAPAAAGPHVGGPILRRASEVLAGNLAAPSTTMPPRLLGDTPQMDPEAAGQELARLGIELPQVRRAPGESVRAYNARSRAHAAAVTSAIHDTLSSPAYQNATAIAKEAIEGNSAYQSYRPASLAREIRRDMLNHALTSATTQ